MKFLRKMLRSLLPLQRFWAPIALLGVLALHLSSALPLQDILRTLSFDLYQISAPRQRESAPVVIIDIDEASLARHGQWPWPRDLTARLLDRIWQAGPVVVGVDILMPEVDRTSACEAVKRVQAVDPALQRKVCALQDNDGLLADALRRGPVVLGAAGIDGISTGVEPLAAPMRSVGPDPRPRMRSFETLLGSIPSLQEAAAGHAILSTDVQYGVVRKLPLVADVGGTVLPSLALEMLRLASDAPSFTVRSDERGIRGVGVKSLFVPTQSDGSLWIHYGHHDPARFVSAAELLEGRVDPALLKQKMVLVGLSGLGLVDFQSTALGERMPGVEIQAQVLEDIFDGTNLLRPHWMLWVEGALMVLIGLAMVWLFPRLGARVLVPLVVGTMVLLWLGGLYLFTSQHLLLDAISPISIFIVMSGLLQADLLIRGEYQRKALETDLQVGRVQAAKARGEMEAAMRIQMGMLPDVAEQFAGESRIDIAARLEPAKLVGGDLFDCFLLDGSRAFFLIGDVCGKGVPASLFMAISKTVCKSLALRLGAAPVDPGELMRQANLEISRDNPEMFFVTAFIGVLDLVTGELTYCNAGHDRPLALMAGEPVQELGGPAGPPVCVLETFAYQTCRRQMRPGELLFLYTDGVTEAFDPAGRLYGRARLDAVLAALSIGATASGLVEGLCGSVHSFAAGADPSDDLTVLALRWMPTVI